MPTVAVAGGVTIGTTEWSLSGNQAGMYPGLVNGIFQLYVDLAPMIQADEFRIRFYEQVLSSGTMQLLWERTIAHYQGESKQILTLPPVITRWAADFTMTKLAGTDHTFNYSIRKV